MLFVQKPVEKKIIGKLADMEDKTNLLLWCWIRAIYNTLTDDQKKIFAEELAKELLSNGFSEH